MADRVEGKVALVTGAARGQGRAHALKLAEEGADVAVVDICAPVETVPYECATGAELSEVAAEVEALGRSAVAIEADVRSAEQIEDAVGRTIETLGGLDILVANAGINSLHHIWELSDEAWHAVLDVNLSGVFRSLRAVLPQMMQQRDGAIVLTASTNSFEPGPLWAHYTAAKHGVVGLMRAAALELGPYGIRVNAVCPGLIDTPMTNWQGIYDMMAGHPDGTREDYVESGRDYGILGGRGALPPSAVSEAVLYLVAESGWAVTGQTIVIDSGHLIAPGYAEKPNAA